jgi:hypothetical protein
LALAALAAGAVAVTVATATRSAAPIAADQRRPARIDIEDPPADVSLPGG